MFYTRKETLEKLAVSPTALYIFIKEGKLTKYRQEDGSVFFEKDEVDRFVEARSKIKAVK